MKKKNGFTLIELIAVLVILAILALIVTPLVMNIIRKAKISADKRSIDAYGRSVELAIANYLLDTGNFPTDLKSLTIEYTGKEVSCNVMQMKENGGIYLSECTVGTKAVKDATTEDGWYHYGIRDLTNEEYVDMYGKKLEAALKLYYDANNTYPESIDTLVIESVGKTVICPSSINYDGTVYLTNCKVDGKSVVDNNQEDGYYHYGVAKKYVYSIGDEVIYNGINYYVIENSGMDKDYITMLKAEPLTINEVYEYGEGHINRFTSFSSETADNINGYGGVAYYTGDNCGLFNGSYPSSGCKTDYLQSDIKYIVDNWAQNKINFDDLIVDSTGYSVRLITIEELRNNLGFGNSNKINSNVPTWVCNRNYRYYWTMSSYDNTIWSVEDDEIERNYTSGYEYGGGYFYMGTVRPVITLKKSALN